MKIKNLKYSTVLIIISLFIFTANMACDVLNDQSATDREDIIKQERQVSPFNALSIGGAVNVVLIQGNKELLIIEADEDMMDKIITEVDNEHLRITTKPNTKILGDIKITVYFRDLASMDIGGAVNVSAEESMKFSVIKLSIRGSSKVKFDMETENLNCALSGASKFHIQGKSGHANIKISGASELDALAFEINNAVLEASGASVATVNATDSLVVEISGASVVKYKQGPEVFKSHVSGGGSLRKI